MEASHREELDGRRNVVFIPSISLYKMYLAKASKHVHCFSPLPDPNLNNSPFTQPTLGNIHLDFLIFTTTKLDHLTPVPSTSRL